MVMAAILIQGRSLDESDSEEPDGSMERTPAEDDAKTAESESTSAGGLRFLFSAPMLLFFVYMALSSVASNGRRRVAVTDRRGAGRSTGAAARGVPINCIYRDRPCRARRRARCLAFGRAPE